MPAIIQGEVTQTLTSPQRPSYQPACWLRAQVGLLCITLEQALVATLVSGLCILWWVLLKASYKNPILKTTLRDKYTYHPYFTDEEN